jgi:hypothetical protein
MFYNPQDYRDLESSKAILEPILGSQFPVEIDRLGYSGDPLDSIADDSSYAIDPAFLCIGPPTHQPPLESLAFRHPHSQKSITLMGATL